MLPLIPLAIKGGLALGASLLGNKMGKVKPTEQENQVTAMLQKVMQQNATGGQGLVGMGQQGIQQPMNYYSGILSGNRGQMTSALAPEVNRIGDAYQNARQTSSELMPRGGARASQIGQLPFQQARDTSTLFQQARPGAAQGLGGLSGQLISQGINMINSSTSAGRDILSHQDRLRELETDRGQKIGGGLYDLIQKFGFPAVDQWLKQGGGGDQVGAG